MKLSCMYKPFATAVILGHVMVAPILSHADTIQTSSNMTQQKLQIAETNSNQHLLMQDLRGINLIGTSSHDELDFGEKSSKDTNDFVTKKFKKQTKGFSRYKIEAIQDFNEKEHKDLNQSLIQSKGKTIPKDPNKAKIMLLDGALQELKTESTVKVYTQQEGSLPKTDSIAEGLVIKVPEYMTPSLNHVSGDKALWIIQVPKGTHAAYMNNLNNVKGESGLLIERGSRLQITHISTFNDRGAPRTKIEAKLLPKEEILEEDYKIDQAEQEFTDTFGLSVSLLLMESSSQSEKKETLEKADRLITTVSEKVQNLPNGKELINKLARAGITINLDEDEVIHPESGFVLGLFHPQDNSIDVAMNDEAHQDENEVNATLAHELGHAIDFRLLNYISHNPDFQQIFSLEKQAYIKEFGFNSDTLYPNLSIKERSQEDWADAFSRFVVEPEKLKKSAPKTYQYIDKILRESL
ncbi:hypothetical protein ER45_028790 (plasmid) [Bacillus mycoides]|nr:hypothetical protein ER45_028790 [Bacillus mycoides]